MIVPQIPILSPILYRLLTVGTATYTTQGSGIARYLFAGIYIVLCEVDSPAQAERIVGDFNKIAKKPNAN